MFVVFFSTYISSSSNASNECARRSQVGRSSDVFARARLSSGESVHLRRSDPFRSFVHRLRNSSVSFTVVDHLLESGHWHLDDTRNRSKRVEREEKTLHSFLFSPLSPRWHRRELRAFQFISLNKILWVWSR